MTEPSRRAGKTEPRRRAGIVTFLIGAAAGIGGARLFAPRPVAEPDMFSERSGRGEAGVRPTGKAVAAGHEVGDASARGIVAIMAIFAVSAVSAIGAMITFLHYMHRADTAREAGLTPLQRIHITPPEPNLQADPFRDIARLRTHEYRLLHSLARVDATTARIPIDQAMTLIAGQPLDRADTQGDGKPTMQGSR